MGIQTQVAPFGRGEYYDPAAAGNQPDLGYEKLVGMECEFPDINRLSTNDPANWPQRSGAPVRCRLVRNGSGGALSNPAKRLGLIDVANPGSVTAYAAVANIRAEYHIIDEYLPAGLSLPAGALFWVVVRGRSLVRTSSAGGDFPLAARAGDFLIPNATGYVQTFPATDQDAAGTNRDHMLLIRYTRIRTLAAVDVNTVDTDIAVIVDQQ